MGTLSAVGTLLYFCETKVYAQLQIETSHNHNIISLTLSILQMYYTCPENEKKAKISLE